MIKKLLPIFLIWICLAADSNRALDEKVNDYIQHGWKPQGGIAVVNANSGLWFFQAMVKP